VLLALSGFNVFFICFNAQLLSRNVVPEHYDLVFKPNFENIDYDGFAKISVIIHNKSDHITLHSRNILILKAILRQSKDEYNTTITYNYSAEKVNFNFHKFVSGACDLTIHFIGYLNASFNGFTRVFYTRHKLYGAMTNMHQEEARRVFPCFDEPAMKATFNISVIVPNQMTTLSNMPIVTIEACEKNNSLKKVSFAKTPKMSTYLVAIVVGYYESFKRTSLDGKVVITMYTLQGREKQVAFALDVAVRVLDFLQKQLKIAYHLPKIDFVPIENFTIEGMENWGLITIVAEHLLVDETTSYIIKRIIVDVIAHEFAHQWFGNLVTPEWWSHYWLNEGLANFISTICQYSLFPQWEEADTTLARVVSPAFNKDSFESTHPIIFDYKGRSDRNSLYDEITYKKSEAILLMIANLIGYDKFFKALFLYLTRHKFGNVKSNDLLASFDELSGKSIGEVMKQWLYQKGYPLISVYFKTNCSLSISQHKTRTKARLCVRLTQRKFKMSKYLTNKEKKIKWNIPVTYFDVKTSANKSIWFSQKIIFIDTPNQIILNYDGSGYYRTRYSRSMYNTLYKLLRRNLLNAKTRFVLQNDFFALVKAGFLSTTDYLRFLTAYKGEEDLSVWKSVDESFEEIDLILSNTKLQINFRTGVRRFLKEAFRKYGLRKVNEEKDWISVIRTIIFKRLGLFGEKTVVSEANEQFQIYINSYEELDANLRHAIFCTLAANSNDIQFKALIMVKFL
ncbi:uncharacterized protein B4U79_03725, partial [Dinothrombium tinctorium]